MKKLLCLSIILTMLLTFAACGSKSSSSSSASSDAEPKATQAQTEKPTAAATEDSAKEEVTLIPGTVYFLNVEENEEPVVKGLALDGNRIGSYVTTTEDDGINGMPISDENIRFVFALNEWIGVRLETTQPEDLSMYIIKRGEKPNVYTAPFEPDAFECFAQANLQAPEDPTQEGTNWGEAYVNPDDSGPGYYDLVITSGKKPVAQVVIKLYNEADLEGKTDAELKQLMEGEVTAAKAKQAGVNQ